MVGARSRFMNLGIPWECVVVKLIFLKDDCERCDCVVIELISEEMIFLRISNRARGTRLMLKLEGLVRSHAVKSVRSERILNGPKRQRLATELHHCPEVREHATAPVCTRRRQLDSRARSLSTKST